MNSRIDNENIVARVIAGDHGESLFEALWKEYYPRLLLFVKPYYLNQKGDLEDGVQDILIKVFQSLKKYKSNYSFNTWLYSIARNYCLNKIRIFKTRRRINEELIDNRELTDSEADCPEEIFLNKELQTKIRQIISTLEESDQQLCYLRHSEGMGFKEIARIINIPEGTAKYRMMCIRQKIKGDLEGYYGL